MTTCCFIGHRNVTASIDLSCKIRLTVKKLIEEDGVSNFLFGSRSRFDDLCRDIVAELKNEYPDVKLTYVRERYPRIPAYYESYLLESYDATFMPKKLENAGMATYVERNKIMIDDSDFCVFYYDENYNPPMKKRHKQARSCFQPKSGTKIAYSYAIQKKKRIVNLFSPK